MLWVFKTKHGRESWMDLHQNARSCPASRALLVERVRVGGWTVRKAAEAQGLSARSAYRWLRRYRESGEAGLVDRPSTPHRIPRRLGKKEQEPVAGASQRPAQRRRDRGSAAAFRDRPCRDGCGAWGWDGFPNWRRPSRSAATRRADRESWCTWTSRNSGAFRVSVIASPAMRQHRQRRHWLGFRPRRHR